MKSLILEVIELDKEAQSEIHSLVKQKDELFSAFKSMKEELTLIQQAQIKTQSLEITNAIAKEYDELSKLTKKKADHKEKNIRAYYNQNKDTWLKELLDYCIKS